MQEHSHISVTARVTGLFLVLMLQAERKSTRAALLST
jgi:hypothetical protein